MHGDDLESYVQLIILHVGSKLSILGTSFTNQRMNIKPSYSSLQLELWTAAVLLISLNWVIDSTLGLEVGTCNWFIFSRRSGN